VLFTDRFTFVHMPKTGGTFVTSVLFRLYEVRWTWLTHLISSMKKNLVYRRGHGIFIYHNNKHGTCSEIPEPHRHKLVLATVRNPYDLYVSQYEFGWWKRKEFLPYYLAVPGFKQDYASFPNLSFAEYVRLTNAAFCRPPVEERPRLGLQSECLVKYFFKDPPTALARADEDYIASAGHRADMFDVHFVRTDRLNEELHAFLLSMGYKPEDVEFVRGLGRILPSGRGRTSAQKWEKYYTTALKDEVRKKEWLFFALFPEFDI
jgi:hypothetical protein